MPGNKFFLSGWQEVNTRLEIENRKRNLNIEDFIAINYFLIFKRVAYQTSVALIFVQTDGKDARKCSRNLREN